MKPRNIKKLIRHINVGLLVILSFLGCNVGTTTSEVKIGSQIWMAENLNIDHFRNGDPIPEAKTDEEWEQAGRDEKPAWCYWNNDPENGTKYGKLYNWYAVNDSRGLAPSGWHIPSDSELEQLKSEMGDESLAGKKLKSTSGWDDNNNGTNESGFNGIPSGKRIRNGEFGTFGAEAIWWSSSENTKHNIWVLHLNYRSHSLKIIGLDKELGLPVRCVKD